MIKNIIKPWKDASANTDTDEYRKILIRRGKSSLGCSDERNKDTK
jgi:hypothetical protein